jgi:hypothetical protein
MQPVLTFNNIPHQRGILAHEKVLGALLYYASELEISARSASPYYWRCCSMWRPTSGLLDSHPIALLATREILQDRNSAVGVALGGFLFGLGLIMRALWVAGVVWWQILVYRLRWQFALVRLGDALPARRRNA